MSAVAISGLSWAVPYQAARKSGEGEVCTPAEGNEERGSIKDHRRGCRFPRKLLSHHRTQIGDVSLSWRCPRIAARRQMAARIYRAVGASCSPTSGDGGEEDVRWRRRRLFRQLRCPVHATTPSAPSFLAPDVLWVPPHRASWRRARPSTPRVGHGR